MTPTPPDLYLCPHCGEDVTAVILRARGWGKEDLPTLLAPALTKEQAAVAEQTLGAVQREAKWESS